MIDQEVTHQVREAFSRMQSRKDLLDLLNMVKPMIYGRKASPFQLKQLTWYANPQINKDRYRQFEIAKKSGDKRRIHAPVAGLKAIQRTLAFVLQCVFEPHKAANGFVRGKSIVDNGRLHEGARYVFNLDLKDFFHSIDQYRVRKVLQLKPFNLHGETSWDPKTLKSRVLQFTTDHNEHIFYKIEKNQAFLIQDIKGNLNRFLVRLRNQNPGVSENELNSILSDEVNIYVTKAGHFDRITNAQYSRAKLADLIASLCCESFPVQRIENGEWVTKTISVLPQGAPTSPVLTNIVCQRLDFLLTGLANRFGLKYSRYADDITFSSMHNVYAADGEFMKELHRIISDQRFVVNEEKVRLQQSGWRQEVTGLVVNEKANVTRRYIKELRMWLYTWERYGFFRANGLFQRKIAKDRQLTLDKVPSLKRSLAGKLDYLTMVKGAGTPQVRKLKSRFDKLSGNKTGNDPKFDRVDHLNRVLELLVNSGLDEAMKLYDEGTKAT